MVHKNSRPTAERFRGDFVMNVDYIEQGDCLELMKEIPAGSIDLTVTSPPYDNLRTYNGNINQWSFDKFQALARELYRVTKDGGVVVWVVNDATINGSETGTSFRQALYFKECGFNIHDTMIYAKTAVFAHNPRNRRYKQCFEYMFILSKGKPKTYNEIKDRPNKTAGLKTSGCTSRNKNGTLRKMREYTAGEYQARFNIWEYRVGFAGSTKDRFAFEHPAIFPEALAQDHILSWSNPGDVVFDPFLGSGTTAKMAILNNRHYVGFELDSEYFDIACKRLDEAEKE